MNWQFAPRIVVVIVSVSLLSISTLSADESDDAQLAAIMKMMDENQAKMDGLESTLLKRQDEVGRAVGDVLAEQAGVSEDLIEGREAEFGRAVTNLIRTFQMGGSYNHQANDSLVKRDLEWLQYLKDKDLLEDAVRHDIEIKTPLFIRRGEWIKKTGDLKLAMNSLIGATCFRDLVQAEGFIRDGLTISYLSPYKHVLDAGTKRNMFDITCPAC